MMTSSNKKCPFVFRFVMGLLATPHKSKLEVKKCTKVSNTSYSRSNNFISLSV